MYSNGGYIGRFCSIAPPTLGNTLRNLSLNVDLTVATFSQLLLPCPIADLLYAADHLVAAPFNTFIQIGFCASLYSDADAIVNRRYILDMHHACARMRSLGCKAAIDVGAQDGYVDLTVERGQLEYSLAYFYYNPKICEPMDESDDLIVGDNDDDDIDDETFNALIRVNENDNILNVGCHHNISSLSTTMLTVESSTLGDL